MDKNKEDSMNLLIYPIGNSDVRVADDTRQPPNYRDLTKQIANHIAQAEITTGGLQVVLEGNRKDILLPIFYETLRNLKSVDEYLFVITDQQPPNEKDTVNAFPIFKQYLKMRNVPEEKIKAHTINFNPTDLDKLMEEFAKFSNIYSLNKYDEINVIIGPGTPQIAIALLLSLSELENTIFYYTSRDTNGHTKLEKIGFKKKIQDYVIRRAVKILIDKYDYVGAYTLLKEHEICPDAEKFIGSIVSRQDFDFSESRKQFNEFYGGISNPPGIIEECRTELSMLLQNDKNALLEELYYQFSLRILSKRYLEAVAMVFRFEEEILKRHVENFLGITIQKDEEGRFKEFVDKVRSNENLKKYLEERRIKYDTPNRVTYKSILKYFAESHNDEKIRDILGFFNSLEPEQTNVKSLSDIRNNSPFAHGFEGITESKIRGVLGYGPETLVQKFRELLGELGIKVLSPDDREYIYRRINAYLKELLD